MTMQRNRFSGKAQGLEVGRGKYLRAPPNLPVYEPRADRADRPLHLDTKVVSHECMRCQI
jgi:hypothetical protein